MADKGMSGDFSARVGPPPAEAVCALWITLWTSHTFLCHTRPFGMTDAYGQVQVDRASGNRKPGRHSDLGAGSRTTPVNGSIDAVIVLASASRQGGAW